MDVRLSAPRGIGITRGVAEVWARFGVLVQTHTDYESGSIEDMNKKSASPTTLVISS
jgi:hypothetical protein